MQNDRCGFRYESSGSWFKGNTHLHSVASDGGMCFRDLAVEYAAAGYDFLFRTDHWVASDTASDPGPHPLLWLDGMELDGCDEAGSYYHVVCLGTFRDIRREMGFPLALRAAREQGGLLILAHPYWTGHTFEEVVRYPFDGVELYNHVAHWLNGKGVGRVHWEEGLRTQPHLLAFAVDDAHRTPEHPGWNGGWIVAQAPECSPRAIREALRHGRFYSSCGPEFRSLQWDGRELRLATSPVRFIRLVGPAHRGLRAGSFDGPLLTECRLSVPRDWEYAYVEIEDGAGRLAWTNTLFREGRAPAG